MSILCVSRVERSGLEFLRSMAELSARLGAEFVLAADGDLALDRALAFADRASITQVKSAGYIESVLDAALVACHGAYVLRLDDDERASPAMADWLAAGAWRAHDHWQFPRIHLWADGALLTPQLFPDYQTRLSVKAKAGGRCGVHAGSPYGGGAVAPVAIEHHKYVVKNYAARRGIAERYDAYCPGYGTGNMIPFSLPEDAYRGQRVTVAAPGDGTVPWVPTWTREEQW